MLIRKVSALLNNKFVNISRGNVELSFFIKFVLESLIFEATCVVRAVLLEFNLEVDDFLFKFSYLLVVLFELFNPAFSLFNNAVESIFDSLEKENFNVCRFQ